MAQVSSNVVWDIVRRESSFLRKSKNIQLASEKLNVRNVNSYKYSGFAQPAVSVTTKASETAGYNPKLQLVRSTKKGQQPAKSVSVTGLSHGLKRASRNISKNTSSTYFRPDLKRDVCAKYSALARVLKKKNPSLPKKTVRPRA